MGGKVLYVEDNPDTAEAVKLILSPKGYDVDLALTGTKGLEMFKLKNYDLVLLDIMLPDISGREVFKRILKSKKKGKSKYAFLSIVQIPEKEKRRLKEQGIVAYIPKPFEKEELVEKVAEIIG